MVKSGRTESTCWWKYCHVLVSVPAVRGFSDSERVIIKSSVSLQPPCQGRMKRGNPLSVDHFLCAMGKHGDPWTFPRRQHAKKSCSDCWDIHIQAMESRLKLELELVSFSPYLGFSFCSQAFVCICFHIFMLSCLILICLGLVVLEATGATPGLWGWSWNARDSAKGLVHIRHACCFSPLSFLSSH